MFSKIFNKKKPIELTDTHESDLALRLMFEIAISDGKLDASELELIKERANKIISGDEKASTIVKKIIDESQQSSSIYPTIKKINEDYNKEEKIELLRTLWRLVTVDKLIDRFEESLFFKIADLINIPRSKANEIRQNCI
jgi:uncharacterized tellurite resistance protein B-like protein